MTDRVPMTCMTRALFEMIAGFEQKQFLCALSRSSLGHAWRSGREYHRSWLAANARSFSWRAVRKV